MLKYRLELVELGQMRRHHRHLIGGLSRDEEARFQRQQDMTCLEEDELMVRGERWGGRSTLRGGGWPAQVRGGPHLAGEDAT